MELLAFNHHANGVIFFPSERNAPSRRHRDRSSFASKTVRFYNNFFTDMCQLKPGIFWNFFLFSFPSTRSANILLALLEHLAAGGLDRKVVLDCGPLAARVAALHHPVLFLGLLCGEALS